MKIFAALLLAVSLAALPFSVCADASDGEVSKQQTSEAETSQAPATEPVITSGNAIVVMSVQTGQLLLNTANAREVDPTCTAKLMTAMLAYDAIGDLETRITVDAAALKGIGKTGDISSPMIGLRAGDTFSARQLIQATLISAANDACNVLAYYCSDGDIAAFVKKMNGRAAELGCTHTTYTNATGLYDGEAYTTVEDVALVAAAFYKYNTLLDLSSQATYVIGGSTIHTKNYLKSESLLKGCMIPSAKGMIAGQRSAKSDYCLITASENEGIGYVYVIMEAAGEIRNNDGTRSFPEENAYADMKKIFEWYRTAYGYVTLVNKGDVLGELPVDIAADSVDHVNYVAAERVERLIPKSVSVDSVERRVTLAAERLSAPVRKGMKVGTLELIYEGNVVAETALITNSEIDRSELLSLFDKFKAFLFGSTMKTVVKILVAVIVLSILLAVGARIYYTVTKAKKQLEKRDRHKNRLDPPSSDESKGKS